MGCWFRNGLCLNVLSYTWSGMLTYLTLSSWLSLPSSFSITSLEKWSSGMDSYKVPILWMVITDFRETPAGLIVLFCSDWFIDVWIVCTVVFLPFLFVMAMKRPFQQTRLQRDRNYLRLKAVELLFFYLKNLNDYSFFNFCMIWISNIHTFVQH